MSTKGIENYEQFNNRLDIFDPHPPPPEPIYDLTASDKTELVKALQCQLKEGKTLEIPE